VNAQLAEMLIESDRRYFAAGAESWPFRGGAVRWMPGLQHLEAGCIVEPTDSLPSDDFAEAAGEAVAAVGGALVRLYAADLPDCGPDWTAAGLASAIELAMARRPRPFLAEPLCPIVVRPVLTDADWAAKERLAGAWERRPDGKAASAREWTALERRKSEAGYAQFYLATIDGYACGTFGLADCGPLLRLKNIAVHPDFQRRGVARAMLDFALRHADTNGFEWLGAFVLQDAPTGELYPSCGFETIGSQTEWTGAMAERATSPAAARDMGVTAC
jgi:GNAT superfamily N-acetyltransferase